MKITVFTDQRFTTHPFPTGVGKHIQKMVTGLASQDGVELSMLAANDQVPNNGFLAHYPTRTLPMSWKAAQLSWTLFSRPFADSWVGDSDWIYCPKNDWIPVRNAKYAVTIHGAHELDPDFFTSERGLKHQAMVMRTRRQYLKMCERADVVLTVSEWLKQFVVEQFGTNPDKVIVVGNGVDSVFYHVGAETHNSEESEDTPYILCLGGLNHIDGGDHILALANVLRRSGVSWRIKVAGNQHEPFMIEKAKKTGVIDLLGYVLHDKLAPLMSSATVFYYPSRYETFGMGAAEAMASGVPVVTSHCTAIPEIVGDCGIYVDPNNPNEAFDAIDALTKHGLERGDLINRARERSKSFTWERSVERLFSALS